MKQTKCFNKVLSAVLCLALIAAMALTFTACSDNNPVVAVLTDGGTLGEGTVSFTVEVVDKNGNKIVGTINTDEKTVGDALAAVELVQGEQGAYGLYIKTVNGITADYDADKTYWAFYIDGQYAQAGIDQTDVAAGAVYSFKVER